jgi:hypothetical protein
MLPLQLLRLFSGPLDVDEIMNHLTKHLFHNLMQDSFSFIDAVDDGIPTMLLDVVKAIDLEPLFNFVPQDRSVQNH